MKLQNKLISFIAATAIFSTLSINAQEIIEPTGLDQIQDIINTDPILLKTLQRRGVTPELAKSMAIASSKEMNGLIKEAIISEGLVNDGTLSVADVREINNYLVNYHLDTWYKLRGQNADADSTGYYAVNRRGLNSSTTILNTKAINAWGKIYNLGFYKSNKNRLSDATGSKSASFGTVGYYLDYIMQNDIQSGVLHNDNYIEVEGTTGTKLDELIDIILKDKGLLRRISTGDIREGAKSADGMNKLIIDAIKINGLGNDEKLTTADIRTLNNYLVANHLDDWAELHGDDENDEETGYHKVQNDGAYTRMFAENVMNSVADGIYHLGFQTERKNRLSNEDGNANKRFEKVAWWLDTMLKTDLTTGVLNNEAYKEVEGTTGTSFDKVIPFIYNDEGLLLNVSMEDIREGAKVANEMNILIIEAIKNTDAALDKHIDIDDVKNINQYLVENYQALWIELHGDDEDGIETGFHRIQNDGARGIVDNKNVINSLVDGMYHLGFSTPYKHRLANEDGNKNKSFKQIAYWLNKYLQDDFASGVFN